jgi:pimeloyl-ACP methyl ester carboxylesterase
LSRVEVDGAHLEVRWAGPPSGPGPAIVLLHEGLGSAAGWRGLPEEIATATGRPTITYSREGYGASDRLREPFGVDFMHREASRLARLLQALSLAEVLLVGHSDGGSIALIAAAQGLPVRGVVALAPHLFVEDESVRAIAEAVVSYERRDLRERLQRQHGENTDTIFRAWSSIWLSPEFRSWSIADLVPRVACPLLAVMGSADPYGTFRQLDALEDRAAVPVQQIRIAGVGHAPHRQRPELVVPALLAFARRILTA